MLVNAGELQQVFIPAISSLPRISGTGRCIADPCRKKVEASLAVIDALLKYMDKYSTARTLFMQS